jgi:hypothetical protein
MALKRYCTKCGVEARPYCKLCTCGARLPKALPAPHKPRTCAKCGATAGRWHKRCQQCGEKFSVEPRVLDVEKPTTASALATARLTAGMSAPQCVCGLRGPHECTRTPEWKQGTLALLAIRRL